jgi:hypothetical protein
MHAYVYAMQMQCNYGAKHLKCYIVPVNEEVAEVKSVPEEEPTSVEVGFNICGIDPEPKLSVDQGKPRLHLTFPCVLKSLLYLH